MRSHCSLAWCGAFLLSLCAWGGLAGEQAKDGPDHLAKEEEKHLKRLATIDRLEEVAKEIKNDAFLEKIKMLRENELRRFEKASERLKRPHGKSGDAEKAGKKGDEEKADKGKHGEKLGGDGEEKGRHEEKEEGRPEKPEKGGEGAADGKREAPEGKGKPEENVKGETRHGKKR